MTAQLAPQAVAKFFDNNGLPLAFGLLTTYQAGNLIKQATYVDNTQTTQNTNPIQLNFRGECALWLDPTLNYKFALTDQAGNTIPGWPVDNIQGPIATPQQIGLILYPRTAAEITAAVTPTNYAYPELDVLRYGADSTGAIDSTAAIMASVSVAHAKGGGRVYLPAGTYLVGTSIQINHNFNNIYFVGDGNAATGLINASATQPAISVGNGSALFHGGVSGMYITTKSGVTALNGNVGIFYNNLSQFILRDLVISNAQAANYRGVFIENCGEFFVYNLFVQQSLNDGITLEGTTDAFMTACNSNSNGGAGYVLNATQGGEFVGCYAFSNTVSGWGLISGSPSTAPNLNNAFFDCVGDTSGSHNWLIDDSFDSWWVGCWGSTQQSVLVNTFACGFQIATQYCQNLKFVSCIALNNNSHGVQCFDSGTSAPQKIEFIGCQYGSTSPSADGNGKAAGGGYGFSSNGAVDHVRIAGGNFDGNATGAIHNTGTGTDIIVTGNPIGFVAINQGTSSITVGNTSVAVTHGLAFTPLAQNIQIIDTQSRASCGINSVWISAVSSTTFTVSVNTAVTTTPFSFGWRAASNGN